MGKLGRSVERCQATEQGNHWSQKLEEGLQTRKNEALESRRPPPPLGSYL